MQILARRQKLVTFYFLDCMSLIKKLLKYLISKNLSDFKFMKIFENIINFLRFLYKFFSYINLKIIV